MSDDTVEGTPADPNSDDRQPPANDPAPPDQPTGRNAPAAGRSEKPVTAGFDTWKVALSDWISALGSPQDPPFSPGGNVSG